jgi:hypothetical protein
MKSNYADRIGTLMLDWLAEHHPGHAASIESKIGDMRDDMLKYGEADDSAFTDDEKLLIRAAMNAVTFDPTTPVSLN